MIVRLRSSRFGYMTTEEYHCYDFVFSPEYMMLSLQSPIISEEVVDVPQWHDAATDLFHDAVTHTEETIALDAFCTIVPGDDFIVERCPDTCKYHAG